MTFHHKFLNTYFHNIWILGHRTRYQLQWVLVYDHATYSLPNHFLGKWISCPYFAVLNTLRVVSVCTPSRSLCIEFSPCILFWSAHQKDMNVTGSNRSTYPCPRKLRCRKLRPFSNYLYLILNLYRIWVRLLVPNTKTPKVWVGDGTWEYEWDGKVKLLIIWFSYSVSVL